MSTSRPRRVDPVADALAAEFDCRCCSSPAADRGAPDRQRRLRRGRQHRRHASRSRVPTTSSTCCPTARTMPSTAGDHRQLVRRPARPPADRAHSPRHTGEKRRRRTCHVRSARGSDVTESLHQVATFQHATHRLHAQVVGTAIVGGLAGSGYRSAARSGCASCRSDQRWCSHGLLRSTCNSPALPARSTSPPAARPTLSRSCPAVAAVPARSSRRSRPSPGVCHGAGHRPRRRKSWPVQPAGRVAVEHRSAARSSCALSISVAGTTWGDASAGLAAVGVGCGGSASSVGGGSRPSDRWKGGRPRLRRGQPARLPRPGGAARTLGCSTV